MDCSQEPDAHLLANNLRPNDGTESVFVKGMSPRPRRFMGASFYNGSMFVFGGHRTAFWSINQSTLMLGRLQATTTTCITMTCGSNLQPPPPLPSDGSKLQVSIATVRIGSLQMVRANLCVGARHRLADAVQQPILPLDSKGRV